MKNERGPVGGAGELTAHEVCRLLEECSTSSSQPYAGTQTFNHLDFHAFTRLLKAKLAAKAPQGVRFDEHKRLCVYCNQGAPGCDRGRELLAAAPKPAPPDEQLAAEFTAMAVEHLDKLPPDERERRIKEFSGRIAAWPAPGAERLREQLLSAIEQGIANWRTWGSSDIQDEGYLKAMIIEQLYRAGREALTQIGHIAGSPEGALPSLWGAARRERLDKIAELVREALAAASPTPTDELTDLREEMKGMVDASWKDACLGWQRDICAAVGLAPVEKSVLLAALRDRHASAERVRELEHALSLCIETFQLQGMHDFTANAIAHQALALPPSTGEKSQ